MVLVTRRSRSRSIQKRSSRSRSSSHQNSDNMYGGKSHFSLTSSYSMSRNKDAGALPGSSSGLEDRIPYSKTERRIPSGTRRDNAESSSSSRSRSARRRGRDTYESSSRMKLPPHLFIEPNKGSNVDHKKPFIVVSPSSHSIRMKERRQKSKSSTDISRSRDSINQSRDDSSDVSRNFADNEEISYQRFGGPEVLRLYFTTPVTTMRSGVVVEVEASTVSITDCWIRRNVSQPQHVISFLRREGGLQPPLSPGVDCVGKIVKLGDLASRVDGLKVGDRVCAVHPCLGGNARFVTLPAQHLIRVPLRVDAGQAACVLRSYVAAHQLLHRVGRRLMKDDRVLITGANGQLGRALVELASLAGVARVYASARRKHKEFVQNVLKATWIPPNPNSWTSSSSSLSGRIDVIIDTVAYNGQNSIASFMEVLHPTRSCKVIHAGNSRELMRKIRDKQDRGEEEENDVYSQEAFDSDADESDDSQVSNSRNFHNPLSRSFCHAVTQNPSFEGNTPIESNDNARNSSYSLQGLFGRCGINDLIHGRKNVEENYYCVFSRARENPEEFRRDVTLVMSYLDAGEINPIVLHRVPLLGVRRAHRELEWGGLQGTIVCMPWKVSKREGASVSHAVHPIY